ncbi:MAG: DNA cytosine methyltransferase [Chloroflexi bacterium]|uniref:DNA cytosine methyltransferase n=1 Tax=Candidatus Flexifilum breve TaxID=3140694 RepID=UPI00313658EC|nr:DNA cytosine methyltransferase [Chloroflexota bacterium]
MVTTTSAPCRQLSLRERARIQTFTDNYHVTGPGFRAQIGEAVPPLMAKAIAEMAITSLSRRA